MNFTDALEIVRSVVTGSMPNEYDGIIVKQLGASNTLDRDRTSNQTHIAISGEQMDMFPYIMADGYFQRGYDDRDEGLKKYFIAQVPLYIYQDNVEHLSGGRTNGIVFTDGRRRVHTSIVRSRRKRQADQVQMSLISMDDPQFIAFRKLLHEDDYLVLLKHKEKLFYDCFGVKEADETSGEPRLLLLNNQFYKLPTNTKVDVGENIIIRDSVMEEGQNQEEPSGAVRKTGAENIILYGVPGAGKSHEIRTHYCSDDRYMERVVFHPDYMYSDFVGQILPRVGKDAKGNDKLEYVFTPGPFTRMLRKAEEDPGHYYYLVIEELNRGNAPAIFGEIFQLLDRKEEEEYPAEEAGESEYGISNYDIAKEVYGDEDHRIRIPSNMYILATMNTADQNIFTLDTAFQRRWVMKPIENRFDKSEHSNDIIAGTEINWGTFATVVNDRIMHMNLDVASSEDKRLGVYFARKRELEADRFPQKALKYLWDDAFRLDRTVIFREDCKSLEEVVAAYEAAEKDKLSAVLNPDVYEEMLAKMGKNNTNDMG
ncbi:MAG: AAA family ATPase [Eubacterium sp.]|nr:AAA family ATPase [Eubacterium sp.]